MNTSANTPSAKLVNAHGLLEALFDESSRPSVAWVRQMQAQRKIRFYKIGHLVRFNVDQVREDLEDHCAIKTRKL